MSCIFVITVMATVDSTHRNLEDQSKIKVSNKKIKEQESKSNLIKVDESNNETDDTKTGKQIPISCWFQTDHGPCDKDQKRWYYDIQSKHCKQFTYGGCQGNANKYTSKNECEKACGRETTPDNHGGSKCSCQLNPLFLH